MACCSWLIVFLLLGQAWSVSAQVLHLRNDQIELGVDRATARLVQFADRVSGCNFADPAQTGAEVWQIEWPGGRPGGTGPKQAAQRGVERRNSGNELLLWWSGFGLSEAPQLRVEVSVQLSSADKSPDSRWQLRLDGLRGLQPAAIHFPILTHLPRLPRERLAMPFWLGHLTRTPRARFAADGQPIAGRREVDYPGHGSMQFMTFYAEDGPGLYLATDDIGGYRKGFAVFSRGEKMMSSDASPTADLNLEVVHQPEQLSVGADRYELPYGVVLGTFRGDWFDAAERYRLWATNQVWAQQSRWRQKLTPAWIAQTGLWMWNRGYAANVLGPAEVLRARLGLPVSVFWHWWHGCAYDTGFPEYLPPRDGESVFTSSLAQAQGQGIHALVYMNQRLWGMTTASWTNEHAARFAVKNAAGEVRPEVYNTFTRLPCASMCMGTSFWRDKYAGIALEALNRLGVDGIYMDQACSSLSCFDPAHGHSLGGGTYWMRGFQQLAADIRARARNASTRALAGEGVGENWLPYLDLMLALDVSRERYAGADGWEPIPLFNAVYHGYGTFYGSYSSLTMPPYDEKWPAEFAPKQPLALLDRKFQRQFCLEQARALVWGQQPTLANFRPAQLKERKTEMDFVMRLAHLRQKCGKYLQEGTMLRPPVVETSSEHIPMSRLSIYAGQQGALREFSQTVPSVLASAWRAPDGRVGVVVVNIAARPVQTVVALDAAVCRTGDGARAVEAVSLRGHKLRLMGSRRSELRLELGPLEAQVWELR